MTRAPFTPDPSQIDLEEALARSATGNLQVLTKGCRTDGPQFIGTESHQSVGPKVTEVGPKDRTLTTGYFHTGLAQCALPRSAVK
jgi:hypothetical protein